MKIIRDPECGIVTMLPLFMSWGIRRCSVKGCRNRPSTIVADSEHGLKACGFCEEHFQQGNVPGGCNFTLEFDDFDAFKEGTK